MYFPLPKKGERFTFDIDIAFGRSSASAVNDIDIAEEDSAIRIRALDLVVLRLQTGIELYIVVRVHVLCFATIILIDLMTVGAIGHMPTPVDC